MIFIRTSAMSRDWRAVIFTAALGGMLLFGGASSARAEDCQSKLYRQEQKLNEAINRHGYNSRQANKERHELGELEQKCGYSRDRNGDYGRDRDYSRDRDYRHRRDGDYDRDQNCGYWDRNGNYHRSGDYRCGRNRRHNRDEEYDDDDEGAYNRNHDYSNDPYYRDRNHDYDHNGTWGRHGGENDDEDDDDDGE